MKKTSKLLFTIGTVIWGIAAIFFFIMFIQSYLEMQKPVDPDTTDVRGLGIALILMLELIFQSIANGIALVFYGVGLFISIKKEESKKGWIIAQSICIALPFLFEAIQVMLFQAIA